MTTIAQIDLAAIAAPDIIEALDFETILGDLKARLTIRDPSLAPVLALESEPLVKFLEELAIETLYLRARINDAARAVMLSSASGTDLDNLGVLMGVERLASEIDSDFKTRIQLSLEGFTSCGTLGAYTFWTLGADVDVKDTFVVSTTPGQVDITVLSQQGDGTPAPALLASVVAVLNDPDIRQLCDTVNVNAATIVNYTIDAVIHIDAGPDPVVVLAAAQTRVDALISTGRKLGRRASRSAIHAALTVPGVNWVDLTQPATDVLATTTEATYCTGTTLTSVVA